MWYASMDGLGRVFDDFMEMLDHFGAKYPGTFGYAGTFNAETGKLVWQLLAESAGVRVMFHATPGAVEVSGGLVTSVRVHSRAEACTISSRFVIDATGEGDLSALAGAQFSKGDPDGGRTLHMTLVATMFDTGKPVTPYLPPGLEPIESEEDLPGLSGPHPMGDGRFYLNMTKVMGHDPTDPPSLSDAELEARKQLARVVHYLQRTKCPRHMLASTGSRIGIREGRRVLGDYVLTESDVLGDGTAFGDGIAVATCQIDFHSLTRPGMVGWRKRVKPYGIPFRSCTVKGFDNLLVAGKCISGDQVAQSSYRMTPTCVGIGQAVGTAAAMASARKLVSIRDLPADELRQALSDAGVELDPARHRMFPHSGESETPNPDDAR